MNKVFKLVVGMFTKYEKRGDFGAGVKANLSLDDWRGFLAEPVKAYVKSVKAFNDGKDADKQKPLLFDTVDGCITYQLNAAATVKLNSGDGCKTLAEAVAYFNGNCGPKIIGNSQGGQLAKAKAGQDDLCLVDKIKDDLQHKRIGNGEFGTLIEVYREDEELAKLTMLEDVFADELMKACEASDNGEAKLEDIALNDAEIADALEAEYKRVFTRMFGKKKAKAKPADKPETDLEA